jgi:hypothetical protein
VGHQVRHYVAVLVIKHPMAHAKLHSFSPFSHTADISWEMLAGKESGALLPLPLAAHGAAMHNGCCLLSLRACSLRPNLNAYLPELLLACCCCCTCCCFWVWLPVRSCKPGEHCSCQGVVAAVVLVTAARATTSASSEIQTP